VIALGVSLLVTKYLWLLLGLFGMVGVIIPATIMGTQIYFDLQLFLLVVGVGFFFMVASGGDRIKRIKNFGTGALSAGSLGFFLGLASLPTVVGEAIVSATQYAMYSLILGTVLQLICQAIANRLEDNAAPLEES
jgi:tetrahydromethanopterin S-methyltransferase subunit C